MEQRRSASGSIDERTFGRLLHCVIVMRMTTIFVHLMSAGSSMSERPLLGSSPLFPHERYGDTEEIRRAHDFVDVVMVSLSAFRTLLFFIQKEK